MNKSKRLKQSKTLCNMYRLGNYSDRTAKVGSLCTLIDRQLCDREFNNWRTKIYNRGRDGSSYVAIYSISALILLSKRPSLFFLAYCRYELDRSIVPWIELLIPVVGPSMDNWEENMYQRLLERTQLFLKRRGTTRTSSVCFCPVQAIVCFCPRPKLATRWQHTPIHFSTNNPVLVLQFFLLVLLIPSIMFLFAFPCDPQRRVT